MRRLPTRLAAVAATLAAATLVATACTSTGSAGGTPGGTPATTSSPAPGGTAPSTTASHAPVTLTAWTYTNLKNEIASFKEAFADVHESYPWITVNVVSGKNDADFAKATTAGNPPDIWMSNSPEIGGKYCHNGTVLDLSPYLAAAHQDPAKLYLPQAVKQITYRGKVCMLPGLSDAYALYYNKAMLAAAGISSPPRTLSELTADAKKLTKRDTSGHVTVFGFVPRSDFDTNSSMFLGVYNDAQIYDGSGKATFATNPSWAKLLTWDKDLIGYYGADEVQKFVATYQPHTDDAGNAFLKGKVAMTFQGEWHVNEMQQYAPKLAYGVAPFPVLDGQEQRYGVGSTVATAFYVSAKSKHPADAFRAIEYMTTDAKFIDQHATQMSNIPTAFTALSRWQLADDPTWQTLIGIAKNPGSYYVAFSTAGGEDLSMWSDFVVSWENGKVKNLADGLRTIAGQVDALNQQSGG